MDDVKTRILIRNQCLVEGVLYAPGSQPFVSEEEATRLINAGVAELPKAPAPKKGATK